MVLSERRRAIPRARARVRLSVVMLACIVSGEAGLPNGDAETANVVSASVAQRRLVCLLASRYSVSRRQRIPTSADWRVRILFSSPPLQYRAVSRVDRSTFEVLVGRMEATAGDIFYSSSGRPQLPVRVQLAITLFRFGHYGNAASVILTAQTFFVSVGSVVKATQRVTAAILRWEDAEIRWPDASRRAALAEQSKQRYGFAGCVGAVDGTTIPLAYPPSVNPWCFFDRHGRYSVNVLVVCDWAGRITNLVPGFTGAAPDTVVQAAAPWHRSPRRYFSLREYLLGDKGMLASVYVLLPHKGPSAAETDNKNVNYQHARRRIIYEHVIGLLKGRWSSLRELRLPCGTSRD